MSRGYVYTATVIDVVDGDTWHLNLDFGVKIRRKDTDLGFHFYIESKRLRMHLTARALGINCAEHGTPGGDAATDYVRTLLTPGLLVTVMTKPDATDKYGGRWDAKVGLPYGRDLAELLVAEGWAMPWDGTGIKPVPPWPRVVPPTYNV